MTSENHSPAASPSANGQLPARFRRARRGGVVFCTGARRPRRRGRDRDRAGRGARPARPLRRQALHRDRLSRSCRRREAPICEYVLDRDVEMQPSEHAWGRGFSDWCPAARSGHAAQGRLAGSLCDRHLRLRRQRRRAGRIAPRQMLRRQLERLAERGWSARAASELEFILFRTPLEQARLQGYRDLLPATATTPTSPRSRPAWSRT